ncbi:TonB-linked outer membrane protein, SusC/RagA family [Sphingobacterium multivorum]|uniref:TonB-linked outer membrane protein, SusC/RagA family n=1 Tax=Sphingobacterium multivorum TaxID=28454 RepID=A0A2X2JD30_SPHMU|nr:carboxypeptidase-like regulatory domain-containing protein [Sphingobacterium multivorum]SPZ85055.1 TonB-linked outer membrane protein, SusC/RagA family [Sphingobacterium multivorum]
MIVIKPKRNPLIPEHKEVLQRGIAGKVVNGKGQALVGTTVTVKGTNISTVTDQDGKFTIQLPTTNATLVVSNVGYQGLEKSVTGNEELSIVLQELVSGLDEVVVVGYGSQKRANVIGAVSTVNGSSVENRSTATLSSSLAGLAAGVNVQTTTGKPGADGANILIREREL